MIDPHLHHHCAHHNNHTHSLREHTIEVGHHLLCDCETEDKLRPYDYQLWCESFEKGSRTFILDEVLDDGDSTLGGIEGLVLNTGLDDIQRGGHGYAGYCSSYAGNSILQEGGITVVFQLEDVFLTRS